MIALEETKQGVILPVRAQAGARKNGIIGIHAGRLKVAVTQAPEKGKANDALRRVLASELDIKSSQVTLLSGETSAQKRFLIAGVTIEQLRAKISALVADEPR